MIGSVGSIKINQISIRLLWNCIYILIVEPFRG